MARQLNDNDFLEIASQDVRLVVRLHDGKFIDIAKVTKAQWKKIKHVYVVECKKHPNAYSEAEPEGGKMALETLIRRIEHGVPICSVCACENDHIVAVGLGARLYYELSTNANVRMDKLNIPPRHEITCQTGLLLECNKCGGQHKKTVKDILEHERRLRRGYDVCRKCASVPDSNRFKNTIGDLLQAATSRGIVVNSIKAGNVVLTPGNWNTNIRISVSNVCVVTCTIPEHRPHWTHNTMVTHVLKGQTGCKICAKMVSNNEMLVLATVMQYLKPSTIQIQYYPKWLAGQHFDVYVKSKRLAIEVDGSQHANEKNPFHNEKTKTRDETKNRLAAEHGIQLIRIDMQPVEDLKSTATTMEKVEACVSIAIPALVGSAPDIFPPEVSAQTDFLYNVHEQYLSLLKQLRPTQFRIKRDRFLRYCKKAGITVIGDYLNDEVRIAVWCEHEDERLRRPMDIMAGMGMYCCRVSAKGVKASVQRAIDLAAKRGYLIDLNRTRAELTDKAIRATTHFFIVCKCGAKYSGAASINLLQGKRFGVCACYNGSNELIDCYEKSDKGWQYNTENIEKVVKPAIEARNKFEEQQREGEFRLLELTLENPTVNRENMLQLMKNEGYHITDNRVRKVWKQLGMRAKSGVVVKPLSHYIQLLKQMHQSENKRRPLI